MTGLKLLALLALCLPSCEVLPTAKFADGSVITGGGTIFTKSATKSVNITHPNGLSMTCATAGHDETVIPGKVVNFWGTKAALESATSIFRTKESTTRILAKEETKKAATRSAADVEKLKILHPVEEAAPVFNPATGLTPVP